MAVETYSVTTNFGGSVDVTILRREILADATITATLNWIQIGVAGDADRIDIDFTPALDATQQTALDAVVAAHPSITAIQGDSNKVYTASVPPTANDDADDEVEVGDLWVDENSNKIYTCADNTVGAAVWTLLAPESGAVTVQTSPPTVNDDDTAGFSIGDFWVNTTTGDAYILTDNSTGAAVWEYITPTVMGGLIFEEEDTTVTTHNNSASYVQKLTATTPTLIAGDYILFWSYGWNIDSTSQNFTARIQQDDTTDIMVHVEEATDSTGDWNNTGSDQRYHASGQVPLTLGAVTAQFDLEFIAPSPQVEVSMWDARMFLVRVA